MSKYELPTYEQCDLQDKNGTADEMHNFILYNEPSGQDSDAWRDQLERAVRYVIANELVAAKTEIERLRGSIGSMMGACGLPDPVEACRTAIEWGNEAFSGSCVPNPAERDTQKEAVLSDAAESLRWMTQEFEYRNRHIEADSDPNNELTGVAPKRSPELQKAVETLEKIDWLLKS